MPREVNERAKEILAQLEKEHLGANGRPKLGRRASVRRADNLQLTLFEPQEHPLLDQIRALDLPNTTPLKAMELLEKWKTELGSGSGAARSSQGPP